ncbi:MAG: dihydrolipoamide acetyltransferase family protein [Tepidisphaeraceae bacterium]
MPIEITMPQLSDTMTEGTVVQWKKKVGDKVKANEPIADVETDKATMEMEAFEGGTLAVIVAPVGTKVPVGQAIAVLATAKENIEDIKKQYTGGKAKSATVVGANAKGDGAAANQSKPVEASGPGTTVPGKTPTPAAAVAPRSAEAYGETARGEHAVATVSPPSPTQRAPSHDDNGHGDDEGNRGRLRVSPLARRIATERKIDLGQVQGSGPGGRIVQRDVIDFTPPTAKPAPAAGGKKPSAPPAIDFRPKLAPGAKESAPLTKIRAVIAQRLQQSKQQVPHFYETVDVDVTDLSGLRQQMNRALEIEGVRLSLGDLIAKAVAQALLVHPALNAHFKDNQITRHGDVNLGMAVALPDGLIVPVLRGVNQLSLRDIRTKSTDLVDRARKQSLKQTEMTGATFTVSNLGAYGVREFSAIINPPEVAILAVGAAEPRPVVRDGQIVARTMMTLTLSADHRAVDGATAAEFLQTLRAVLESPGMMLV